MSGVEGLSRLDNAIEELREQLEATPLCTPVTIQKWAAEALLAALSAIEGGGGALQPSASVPTEQADGGVLTGPMLEAIAHNLCSLHDFDVAFVMGQERFARAVITEYLRALPAPDFALDVAGMIATPPATPIAGDVLWLDRWADLERLAKAATDGPWSVDERLEPECVRGRYDDIIVMETERLSDAAFIAAANPAAILELIAAARHQPNREG
jgi:hypothetical protein